MKISALALVVSFLCTLATTAAPARRALLIGIDDYSANGLRGTPPPVRRELPNLHGAVNDAAAMREVLLKLYEFEERDIVLLKNRQATRAAILREIEAHLERPARSGDILLFYFAGHGSQVPNPRSTERDKRDESLVPADSRVGGRDIRDKELRRRFNRILDRGAKLTVILDACNSGSGARGLPTGARVRGVEPDPRDLPEASDGPSPEDRGALVISAAQDDQPARETLFEGQTERGVFSWAFLRAMRTAEGEPAIDTFLRAQAILRGEAESQQPVIAGNEEARLSPLLGTRKRGARTRRDVVAIEKVRPDGTLILQGGWAHGLTVGSELRRARGENDLRIEITAMRGLSRAEGRVVSTAQAVTLQAGDLLVVATWAAPPIRPLRVWMPSTNDHEPLIRWAREVARVAARRNIRSIVDPTEETPTYVLRFRDGAWELLSGDSKIRRLGSPTPNAALASLAAGSSLFIQLPAPVTLTKAIDVGPGTDREAIEPIDRPEHADYVLAGRLADGAMSYAWVRPFVLKGSRSPLPARTAWQSADQPLALQGAVTRLRRIQAWQILESPPYSPFAYALAVRREPNNAPAGARVVSGEVYKLTLHARTAIRVDERFVYVFTIDSHGKGVLLFPRGGSVENRFPPRIGDRPPEIALEGAFDVVEPYGLDTYFLLTTDEPLSEPWILEWDGVRGRPPATSPLEEVLIRTGSTSRSVQPIRTPSRWSIERVFLEAVPASAGKEQP